MRARETRVRNPKKQGRYLSAVRSFVFSHVLALRIEQGRVQDLYRARRHMRDDAIHPIRRSIGRPRGLPRLRHEHQFARRTPILWRTNIVSLCVVEVSVSTRIFSTRELTRDVAAAKAAALTGPVLITDRGHSAFVMLNIDEYNRLQGKSPSLFALMQQLPELPDDVVEIPRVEIEFRDVEL